jgi:hypothetical protein
VTALRAAHPSAPAAADPSRFARAERAMRGFAMSCAAEARQQQANSSTSAATPSASPRSSDRGMMCRV